MPAEDEAREVRPPTLTEQERALEQAASENLNLKMRVQQLEEQLGERGPGGGDESMSIWDVRSALSRERELHQQRRPSTRSRLQLRSHRCRPLSAARYSVWAARRSSRSCLRSCSTSDTSQALPLMWSLCT